MRFRIAVSLLACLSSSVPLFAQRNELGVFVNASSFSSTTATGPALGLAQLGLTETLKVKVDSKAGYGISFNHFFSPGLSLEASAQTLHGNSTLSVTEGTLHFDEPRGTLELKQFDVALHWYFAPRSSVTPYVGAGIARVEGGRLKIADDPAHNLFGLTVRLDAKTTWLAEAGIDIRVSQNAAITLAAKYTPYAAGLYTIPVFAVGVGDDPNLVLRRLDLNPLTLAAGMRWRF